MSYEKIPMLTLERQQQIRDITEKFRLAWEQYPEESMVTFLGTLLPSASSQRATDAFIEEILEHLLAEGEPA